MKTIIPTVMTTNQQTENPDQSEATIDVRTAAIPFIDEAFAEAAHAGIDGDSFAYATLGECLRELVDWYGESAVQDFVSRIPNRIADGEYTRAARH